MASVQKWGNRRANAYWEAHLKAGHVPPEHKIESFIRSKVSRALWLRPPASGRLMQRVPAVRDKEVGQGGSAAERPQCAGPGWRRYGACSSSSGEWRFS